MDNGTVHSTYVMKARIDTIPRLTVFFNLLQFCGFAASWSHCGLSLGYFSESGSVDIVDRKQDLFEDS